MKRKSLSVLGLICMLTMAGCQVTQYPSSSSSQSTSSESVRPSSTTSSTTSSSSSSTSSSSSSQMKYYNVALPSSVAGAYVSASSYTVAAGDRVTITVAMTDDNYELVSVKLGDEALNGVADENNARVTYFSFQMGEADAQISVETREIPPVHKDHTIMFEENEFAFAMGLADEADTGDVVNFKMSVQSGYELTGVSVYTVAEEPEAVEVSGNPIDGYSFTMPDADVKVSAEALGAYFKVSVSEEVFITDNDGVERSHDDYVYGFIDEDGKTVTSNSTFIRAGSELLVVAERGRTVDVNGYFANGVAMVEDESEDQAYYVFKTKMPAKNVEITTTGELKQISINLNVAEHIDAVAYRYEGSEEVALGAEDKLYPGETIKVVSTSIDPENYDVGKYGVRYNAYKNSNAKEIGEQSMSSVSSSNGIATFTVPYGYFSDNTLTVDVAEKDLNLYRDAAFLGEWTGANYWNWKTSFALSSYSNKVATFAASGSVRYDNTNYDITSYEGNTVNFSAGTYNNRFMTFDGNIGFIPYSSSATDWTTAHSDLYFMVKGYTSTSSLNYTVYASSSDKVAVIQAYDGTTYLGAGLIDSTPANEGQYVVPNVEVELLKGTAINESGAAFVVKKDGQVLESVNIGAELGTYTNAELGSLTLDGLGAATLGEATGTYTIDGNVVTVTINDTETKYSIDTANKTFAVYTEAPAGTSSLAGTYDGPNGLEVVLNADGTGSWDGYAFTWNTSTYTVSPFGAFTSTNNYFEINEDGTLTFHIDDEYGENPFTGTFTKRASFYGTWTGQVTKMTNGGTGTKVDMTLVLTSDGKISIDGTELGNYTVEADGTITWESTTTNDNLELTFNAEEQTLTIDYMYEKGWNYYDVVGTFRTFTAE